MNVANQTKKETETTVDMTSTGAKPTPNNQADVQEVQQKQVQREPGRKELERWLLKLTQIGQRNLDLVRFAKFLYVHDYSVAFDYKEENAPNLIYYKMRPLFCNIKGIKFKGNIFNRSKLEQCYKCFLYTDHSYIDSISLDSPWQDIEDRCSHCKLIETKHELCPYSFARMVGYIAEKLQMSSNQIFHMILGDYDIDFYKARNISVPEHTKSLLFSFDEKSSLAAYLLLKFRLFQEVAVNRDIIEYQYVPLCHTREKQSFVNRITNFWKTRTDTFETLPISKITQFAQQKPDCFDCNFESCPHKVAAAFTVLGKFLNIDPMDLAYYVACNNTISSLSLNEHDQFIKFIDLIKDIPLTPESYEEIISILRYAVNRHKNKNAPFLPINIVLHTGDEVLADQFYSAFDNVMWFFDYFGNNHDTKSRELSVATLSLEDVIREYEEATKGTIFHIKQIELLELSPAAKILMPKLCRIMKEKKDVFTVVSGDFNTLSRFFEKYQDLYHQTLKHHLMLKEMGMDAVFKNTVSKLDDNFEIEDEVLETLRNYIYKEYDNSEMKGNIYVDRLYDKIVFNHFNAELGVSNVLQPKDIPAVKKRRSEEEIFAELNRMTGLVSVKNKLSEINDLVRYFMKCDKKVTSRPNMHMVFAGNAGTGKTTVAKLMAEILYSIGFIRQNKLVVCSGKDLIAEYLGQSQQKMVQKCEQAYDGILFIDEAYQLNPFSTGSYVDPYKQDVINELIQQMENNRDRLIVIFAGYTDEMRDFVKHANPGLESRIATILEFPDYSDDELLNIFENIALSEGLHVNMDASQRVLQLISEARDSNTNFGNARFARNIFERSLLLHARNTKDIVKGDARLMELTREDITI